MAVPVENEFPADRAVVVFVAEIFVAGLLWFFAHFYALRAF